MIGTSKHNFNHSLAAKNTSSTAEKQTLCYSLIAKWKPREPSLFKGFPILEDNRNKPYREGSQGQALKYLDPHGKNNLWCSGDVQAGSPVTDIMEQLNKTVKALLKPDKNKRPLAAVLESFENNLFTALRHKIQVTMFLFHTLDESPHMKSYYSSILNDAWISALLIQRHLEKGTMSGYHWNKKMFYAEQAQLSKNEVEALIEKFLVAADSLPW
jgi:hypothetical protein